MAEITAFHVADTGPVGLNGFNETIILKLRLPPGKYVAHARIEIFNGDGDYQGGRAGLRVRSTLGWSDFVDSWMADQSRTFIPLQAVLDLPEGDTVDLVAATYDGDCRWASLIAFNVDDLRPPL